MGVNGKGLPVQGCGTKLLFDVVTCEQQGRTWKNPELHTY